VEGKKETSAFPLTQGGTVDKAAVKELYDRSVHIEWTPFAQSMGWDPVRSRALFPTSRWIKEKRFSQAKLHAETLHDQLQRNKPKISEDIIRTLRTYPEAHDKFLTLLEGARVILNNELAEMMKKTQAAVAGQGKMPEVRKGFIADIAMLSGSMKSLTESKYRSLLLTDLTIRAIDEQTQAEINRPPEQAITDNARPTFDFEIMGMENISVQDLEKLHHRYYDRPSAEPLALPGDEEDEEVAT
jgi:hypothetical protein